MVLDIEGQLWTITYFQHVKPGKGGAFVRTKLKNVLTGAVVDKTFRSGEKVTSVRLERRPVNYSYSDGQLYHFMDAQTFEMIPLSGDVIGDEQLKYLKENMECEGLVHDEKVIAVDLPQFVELAVVKTDPGVRGDTAQGGTKPAELETGASVNVPLFVEEGDIIRVSRRSTRAASTRWTSSGAGPGYASPRPHRPRPAAPPCCTRLRPRWLLRLRQRLPLRWLPEPGLQSLKPPIPTW
jgi:elongation factor P